MSQDGQVPDGSSAAASGDPRVEGILGTLKTELQTISSLKATADSQVATIGQLADVASQASGQVTSSVALVESAALAAKARIAELAGLAESSAQAVEAAQKKADELSATIEKLKSQAQAYADEAKRHRDAATAEADSAKQKQESATTDSTASAGLRTTIEGVLKEVQSLRARSETELRAAEANHKTIEKLAEIAATIDQRVAEYEKNLNQLHESASERLRLLEQKIEGLLPFATSAGLAAAFHARKIDVNRERKAWTVAFLASLLSLAGASYILIGQPVNAAGLGAWPDVVMSLVRRFAVLGPLLWFCIIAAKQLKTLLQVEEDYAHKVVMSNSFEGYKRQVEGITDDGALGRLTANVIDAIRRSPGRFYAKQTSDSPYETFSESAKEVPKVIEATTGKAIEAVTKSSK